MFKILVLMLNLCQEFLEGFFVADNDLVRFDVDEFEAFEGVELARDRFTGRADPLRNFFPGEGNRDEVLLVILNGVLSLHIQNEFYQTFFSVV